MRARDDVLARVRAALADVPASERPDDVPVPRDYRRHDAADAPARFLARVAAYRAAVHRCDAEDVPDVLRGIVDRHGARRVVVPAGLPESWTRAVPEPVLDRPLSVRELDAVDGVLTTCAVAIADTGTVVLTGGPGQGRRALTLLPDLHVCVLGAGLVVGTVPEAFDRLAALGLAGAPLTFVSGPSATSDIEMSRIEGVHGPRRLEVVVVDGTTGGAVEPASSRAVTPAG